MIYDHTKDNVDCGDACTQDHCCTEFTLISSGTCENTAEYYNPDDTQCETYKIEEHGNNGQYKGHGWDDAFHNGAYSHISHPPFTARLVICPEQYHHIMETRSTIYITILLVSAVKIFHVFVS